MVKNNESSSKKRKNQQPESSEEEDDEDEDDDDDNKHEIAFKINKFNPKYFKTVSQILKDLSDFNAKNPAKKAHKLAAKKPQPQQQQQQNAKIGKKSKAGE